ncbi:MAG: peptidyl-prolyl cis-trans isomerase [Tannerellaceae bacterium]|nr:peptidyl-prolyl cis-trans isomerase [Tannerellaceae bacterium]MCC8198659.1 peptidyl-prolyl cis-trans isomerase [Tannerellaceae bacterium]
MKSCFIFIAFVSLLCSCKGSHSVDDTNVLVKMKDRTLYRSDIESMIPRGISSMDSLLFAENLVKKWIKDVLVYEVALRNLNDEQAEINKLVEEYRHSLIRYRYQEKLVKERLSVNIRESEKLNYYEENQKKFILDKTLIKGLFLKIPADAPGLVEIKKWYRSNSESSLEKIEKYSIQNALIYEYFYDRWVDFEDVMDNIPMHISNANSFLKANRQVEFTDSAYCYLLNIEEYLLSGSVAPYDYAETQIVDMLINQKKVDFLRNFENELYNNAIKRGEVQFHSTEP